MKSNAVLIARVLIDSLKKADQSQHADIIDDAIQAALQKGVSMRTLKKAITRILKEADTGVDVNIILSDHASKGEHLVTVVKNTLNRDVHSSLHQDQSILGGAIVSVGDDRFDFSVRTALSRAASLLQGTSPQARTTSQARRPASSEK